MRLFVLADRWQAERREVLKLFLYASQAGLLDLSWDVICPSCRGAPERHQSLRQMKTQAHCPACNIRCDSNFADSVEVTFRPNPSIRCVVVTRYCSGGPMNAPHVVVQQQIPGRQTRTLELALSPRTYRIRSVKLSAHTRLNVTTDVHASSAVISIRRPSIEPGNVEASSQLTLTIRNDDPQPITVMLERVAGDEQTATAATVIAMNEFRTLFSEEVLQPDTLVSVGAVTLLFTDLKSSTALYEAIGEAPAYGLVRRHFDLLKDCIARHDGGLVKTIGDAVMAAFVDPANAVEAAFDMHRAIAEDNASRDEPQLSLKVGIHHGSCIAVNLNDILDYFGTAVNVAARVQKESSGGDTVITEGLWQDPHVQAVIQRTGCVREEVVTVLRGLSGTRKMHRLKLNVPANIDK